MIDLNTLGLIGTEETPAHESEPLADDMQVAVQLMETINASLATMKNSLAAQTVELRQANDRIALLEKFVSYLISVDPGSQARFAALDAAAQNALKDPSK